MDLLGKLQIKTGKFLCLIMAKSDMKCTTVSYINELSIEKHVENSGNTYM